MKIMMEIEIKISLLLPPPPPPPPPPPSIASPFTFSISRNQSGTTFSTAAQFQPPVDTSTFHSFIIRFSTFVFHDLSQRWPWLELIDCSFFAYPDSLPSMLPLTFTKTYLTSAS
ncbi:PRA1 family protein B1 [Camellia lanceoleosa]|uniref:PRA1 family protein B1 n=1 Tax=Camellia lanceoleosa TaxID=1840588 RepID=A0ACC0HBF0_9ERIC|nr:PRA1 family protein B1 [Camellia lanceoleosa]